MMVERHLTLILDTLLREVEKYYNILVGDINGRVYDGVIVHSLTKKDVEDTIGWIKLIQ